MIADNCCRKSSSRPLVAVVATGETVGVGQTEKNSVRAYVFRFALKLRVRQAMLMTKRKPATIGEILVEEFMKPIGLTQGALAQAMGVQRKHVNELCNDRRNVTAATALILARVFGNSPDFWLNVQRRSDLWEAMHSPRERKRIERARPLTEAA